MRYLLVISLFFSTFMVSGQSNRLALVNPPSGTVEVKIVVLDEENAMEPLAFALVVIQEKAQEIISNTKGESLTNLRPGIYTLEIQFVGYRTKTISNVKVVRGKPLVLKTSLQALQLEPSVSFDEFFSEKTGN